jgi:hypothetical protein
MKMKMIMTAETNALPSAPTSGNEVSLTRLYVLRAAYLLIVVGGGLFFLPQLFNHAPDARGVVPSMLCGLWVLSCFGLRYPLQMLPILLFELTWKTIWLFTFGLPQRMAGVNTDVFKEDFQAIAFAPVLFAAVIPWGYFYRTYLKKQSERWRVQI